MMRGVWGCPRPPGTYAQEHMDFEEHMLLSPTQDDICPILYALGVLPDHPKDNVFQKFSPAAPLVQLSNGSTTGCTHISLSLTNPEGRH